MNEFMEKMGDPAIVERLLSSRGPQKVDHLSQSFSWDCGLACAEMILHAFPQTKDITLEEIRQVCTTKSVWTIDIAYLFRHFNIPCTFYTCSTEVRQEYSSEQFYASAIKQDTERVNKLFELAELNQITIVKTSIKEEHMKQWFLDQSSVPPPPPSCNGNPSWTDENNNKSATVVIALVDKRYLRCVSCPKVLSFFPDLIQKLPLGGYKGHFVVVCAYDEQTNTYLIRDPAKRVAKYCIVRCSDLEHARTAYGTDEDLIKVEIP